MPAKTPACFIRPMLLLRRATLPEGQDWLYEIKYDGYRAIAFKSNGKVYLRSRNDKNFNLKYPEIVQVLSGLPNDTVIDGEIVALDDQGRPSFNALQTSASSKASIVFFVFDLLVLAGRNVMGRTLEERRHLLESKALVRINEPVRYSPELKASLPDLMRAVKDQGIEGLVAKRRASRYESGQRSGVWQKMRINHGQEFVIGGYTEGSTTFDGLIFGYYEGARLMYAGRTRSGFTPASRAQLYRRFQKLKIPKCPFANLPDASRGRWGQGLTAEKMKDCRWLKPVLVGQFEFLEWTGATHLRHSKFVGLREDKHPREVRRNSE